MAIGRLTFYNHLIAIGIFQYHWAAKFPTTSTKLAKLSDNAPRLIDDLRACGI